MDSKLFGLFKKGSSNSSLLGKKVKGERAYQKTLRNKFSKWPSRGARNRIEPLCQPNIAPEHQISPDDKIFTIGSCFARSIELALKEANYNVPSADVRFPEEELWEGTRLHSGLLNKYTPQSMLNELEYVFNDRYSADSFLVEGDQDKYFDYQLHTNKGVTYERGIQRREQIKTLVKEFVTTADVIIVTLGLVEVWWDDKNKLYLNEAPPKKMIDKHKGRFFFKTMSPSEVFESVSKIIELLKKYSKKHTWIMLTVSPVPLARTFRDKDVIVANMYSKSVLRVAAELESEKSVDVEYFPSFESVMLSDRKKLWKDDLIHLEYSSIKKITDRVVDKYSQKTK